MVNVLEKGSSSVPSMDPDHIWYSHEGGAPGSYQINQGYMTVPGKERMKKDQRISITRTELEALIAKVSAQAVQTALAEKARPAPAKEEPKGKGKCQRIREWASTIDWNKLTQMETDSRIMAYSRRTGMNVMTVQAQVARGEFGAKGIKDPWSRK